MTGLKYLIWFQERDQDPVLNSNVFKLDCAYGTARSSTDVTWTDQRVKDLTKQERNVLKNQRPEQCWQYNDFVFSTFKPFFVSERLPCCKRLVYTNSLNQSCVFRCS